MAAPIFSFCNVAVMPVRSEPFHRAEQTTQLLFGEKAEILDVNSRDWARIKIAFDGYEVWFKISQLAQITRRDYKKAAKYISNNHLGKLLFDQGEMAIPLGCELTGLKSGNIKVNNGNGSFKGKKRLIGGLELNADNLIACAKQYLHAPYLWGGRSVAGIDCSGLSQMAFKLCNYPLPRDAAQQAEKGVLVEFLQNSRPGDLAFFDDKDGRIIHVGLLIDHQNIIHATDASGRVVIDRIDLAGIVSVSLKKRTHNLRFVKRIISSDNINEIPGGSILKLL